MLTKGTYLQGRYEILEKVGTGGMADVYKAMCHTLNRMVAIKVLKEEFNSDENFVNRFKREAQAAAGLAHPNIVNVYDVVNEESLHYIVMELVEGITLKSYIAKKGQLEVKETIGIAIQVGQGMWAAHQQNIIHRDIKPQNIIISKDGKVKVADFGIARAVSSHTQDSHAIGSVHYIAPEQARGELVDARSDIYSLGITMFEMVTGRLPFDGENSITVAMAHLENELPPFSNYNAEIPESLEQIILKCTEKRPENRYANTGDVIADLRMALINPEEGPVKAESPLPKSPLANADREFSGRGNGRPGDNTKQQLEKIFTFMRIFAAVILVLVLFYMVFQLGKRILNPGQLPEPTEASVYAIGSSVPEEVTTAIIVDGQVFMPGLVGRKQYEAEVLARDRGLVLKVTGVELSEIYPTGVVMTQDVEEGAPLEKGTTVYVTVSKGNGVVDLSSLGLEGKTVEEAAVLLEETGLLVRVLEEHHDSIPAGQVIRFAPYLPREGDTVELFVSKGPDLVQVSMPDLSGKTREQANEELAALGLVEENSTEEFSDVIESGCIISQLPLPGTLLPKGSKISLVYSKGPEVTEITQSDVRYIASIDTRYDLKLEIGPGATQTSVQIMIRLKQEVNGSPVYQNLMEPRTVIGDSVIPVSFSRIEGVNGVETGEIELVNLDEDRVLAVWPVSFFPVQ